ncbi:Striatin [Dipodascopsis tothii]|uniref:Striatin n=1 Tax=Dipodascopsis tothii TaxID=44089 RepID=UPI0034CD422A
MASMAGEYSLQGVMRFLQSEWQKNERDRMQWEIERAEMKTRIAKLEGERRGNEMLMESLARRVRMLERALEEERGVASTGEEEPPRAAPAPAAAAASEIEQARARSRQYMDKCLQEVSYLLAASRGLGAVGDESGARRAAAPL